MVILLTSSTFLYLNIVGSVFTFLNYDVNTVVGVTYVSDHLNFPAVTLCNYNMYRKSQVNEQELFILRTVFGVQSK